MGEIDAKRFLRLPKVEDRTGLKHSQIHTLEKRGKFPRRVKISDRASGWLEHEVIAWLEEKVVASRSEPMASTQPNETKPDRKRVGRR